VWEKATGERAAAAPFIDRSIRRNLALAEERLREGDEHGGARQRLCRAEAQDLVARARQATAVLKQLQEREG
jgi:hypothetical protein